MGNKNSGLKTYAIPFNDSEESMYWLGYICADGNVQYSKKHRVYRVSLFSMDKDIIDKFILFMGNRCKYHLRKKNNLHQGYVNSRQLCEFLIDKYNIIPNKGLVLNPNIEFNRHFLRGYFDGDGSIRKGKKESKITCGSIIFINKISKYLNDLNIFHKIRKKGNAYDICIERVTENEKFLKHLYKNSNIYLNRKYKQYAALYGNI